MKDTEDEYEKAEKRLQEQLRETKDQLNSAQRVMLMFCVSWQQLLSVCLTVLLCIVRHILQAV